MVDDSKDAWKNRPTLIEDCPEDIDYVVFIDENGSSEMKSIYKAIYEGVIPEDGNRYLNVCSIIMTKEEFFAARDRFTNLKKEFWPDGLFEDKRKGIVQRVCLHTKDISKKQGAFDKKIVDHDLLYSRITEEIEKTEFKILNAFIDKYTHFKRYVYADDPYGLATTFIFERIVQFILKDNEKALVICEQRGKNEDQILLQSLRLLFESGTQYVTKGMLSKIKGVYFNPKHPPTDSQKSFVGLEIADLCAYPIYKYCKYSKKDMNYQSIESKIYGYPHHLGYGLKRFP